MTKYSAAYEFFAMASDKVKIKAYKKATRCATEAQQKIIDKYEIQKKTS